LDLIPEIRAHERTEEAMVALLPHMTQSARADILRAWTLGAGADPGGHHDQNHDLAWDSLRTLVRPRG
jgi:hypothetical protein